MPKQLVKRRRRLAEAQNWRCCWCGGVMSEQSGAPDSATIEHVAPRRLGGADEIDNLVAACYGCNYARGGLHCTKAFYRLRRKLIRNSRWPPCKMPTQEVRRLMAHMTSMVEERRLDRLDQLLEASNDLCVA